MPGPAALPVPAGPVIDLAIEDESWRAALERCDELVHQAAEAALAAAKAPAGAELSILLTSDAAVQRLNRDFRGQDKPTNVLSFPFDPPAGQPLAVGMPAYLGDIAIAFDTTRTEAARDGKSLSAHVSHLTVHGVLHLLGYDHIKDDEALIMERLETAILAGLGISDPYEAHGHE